MRVRWPGDEVETGQRGKDTRSPVSAFGKVGPNLDRKGFQQRGATITFVSDSTKFGGDSYFRKRLRDAMERWVDRDATGEMKPSKSLR
jgi:hypothetical protein